MSRGNGGFSATHMPAGAAEHTLARYLKPPS